MGEETREDWGRVCGDVEEWAMLVRCECGHLRQINRPHGYTRPAQQASEDKK